MLIDFFRYLFIGYIMTDCFLDKIFFFGSYARMFCGRIGNNIEPYDCQSQCKHSRNVERIRPAECFH